MPEYTTVFEEDDPPVEVIVGSWPAARRMLARFIPNGQIPWEGTEAAYFSVSAPHMLPFYLIVIGSDRLTLYCRSLGGELGTPIVIARVSRTVVLELPRIVQVAA